MTTTVTTYSETYIKVSGDVNLRITPTVWPGPSEGFCLAFSGGTLLFCGNTPGGLWQFEPLAKGRKWLPHIGFNDDKVILGYGIEWVDVVDQDKYAQHGEIK